MKIIIECLGETLSKFDPARVHLIAVTKYFETDSAEQRAFQYSTYVNHLGRPINKSELVLSVHLRSGEYHLYDPKTCFITFG